MKKNNDWNKSVVVNYYDLKNKFIKFKLTDIFSTTFQQWVRLKGYSVDIDKLRKAGKLKVNVSTYV